MQVLSFISTFKAFAVNLTEAMSPPSTTPANGELSFPSSEYLENYTRNNYDFHNNLHNLPLSGIYNNKNNNTDNNNK